MIAIIAVLIALLLPAVQQAREAARRTQCRNNLHQLALAMHNYHDTHSTFPPGSVQNGHTVSSGQRTSAFVMVLPFIDESALYNAFNFSVNTGTAAAPNTTVCRSQLSQLLCPSDPKDQSVYTSSGGWNYQYKPTAYGVCLGSREGMMTNGASMNGIFYWSSRVRVRDIRDGTSQTIMIGHLKQGGAPDAHDDFAGRQWAYMNGVFVGTCKPMNSRYNGQHSWTVSCDMAWSLHEGGAFFAFADGAVRFLSENIDQAAYEALSTRANNELVDDEDY